MFYLFVICFWMLSDFRINILCFGIFSYLRSFNTEILESKAKCFMWCEGRHWVAVCHTCLIFLLGTKIEYISQSPLQLSVNSRNNSFHRNVGRLTEWCTFPVWPIITSHTMLKPLFPHLLAVCQCKVSLKGSWESRASVRLFLKDCGTEYPWFPLSLMDIICEK